MISPARFIAGLLLATLCLFDAPPTYAQAASCISLSIGQTQDITAFSVCKKVSLNSVPEPSAGVAGLCVPANTTAAEWQSFYNNPPAGVTIAECATGCTGYSLGGYCYFHAGDQSANSCDTTCASLGGCNEAGVRYIGSDDSSGSRCTTVASAISGVSITPITNTGSAAGCGMNTYKGGWLAYAYYSPTTVCADTSAAGRICACNGAPLVQTFLASGTWIRPATGTSAFVQCWGGGAGGRRDPSSCNNGGGGGGGYSEATIALNSLPSTVSVTIGAGGTAGSGGGATSFGAYLTANGGGPAPNATGGTGGWGNHTIGANGGTANVGSSSTWAGAGGGGGGCVLRAGGSSTYGGAGGATAANSSANAASGQVPGGGGGGARNGAAGAGGGGKCIVTVN